MLFLVFVVLVLVFVFDFFWWSSFRVQWYGLLVCLSYQVLCEVRFLMVDVFQVLVYFFDQLLWCYYSCIYILRLFWDVWSRWFFGFIWSFWVGFFGFKVFEGCQLCVDIVFQGLFESFYLFLYNFLWSRVRGVFGVLG